MRHAVHHPTFVTPRRDPPWRDALRGRMGRHAAGAPEQAKVGNCRNRSSARSRATAGCPRESAR
jgi:hypothetical protein